MSKALCASLVIAVTVVGGAAVDAAENHALNRVWSRMADIQGEYGSVESAEFSADSQFIVTGSKYDNTVRMWRTEDGHMLWKTTLPAEIERVAWTADGAAVVSGSEDHFMRVLDAETGEILREIEHGSGIDSIALSSDGRLMAVGEEASGESSNKSSDGTAPVVLYDTETWEEVRRVDQITTANEIDFTSDDRSFVVVGTNAMRIWETATGRLVSEFELYHDRKRMQGRPGFICVKISPDDRVIAVGNNDGWLYFFDGATGEYIRRLNRTGEKIETVEWTADGQYVLTSGKGDVIDFFETRYALDTSLGNSAVPLALRVPMTDQLEYMHFNSSGAMLTTAHQDGTVQLWTYMSDNPGINQRSHRSLLRRQAEEFADETK